MFQSDVSIVSFVSSVVTFFMAAAVQVGYFESNRKKLRRVRHFFSKMTEFRISGDGDSVHMDEGVAVDGSQFQLLIRELND